MFVYDRVLDNVTRVSVDSGGNESIGGGFRGVISGDGSAVAFWSYAADLVPNDTNFDRDVFVHDLTTGQTTRATLNTNGQESYAGCAYFTCRETFGLDISGDGRFVAFASDQGTLVAGDSNGAEDIFVRDRVAGTTVMASVFTGGAIGIGWCRYPSISSDGRFVVFDTFASLHPSDVNATLDVYIRDLWTGVTELVGVTSAGAAGAFGSYNASLSANGRHVAFLSLEPGLVPNDTNGMEDIFTFDRYTSSIRRATVGIGGQQMGISVFGTYGVSVTDDGRVLFPYNGPGWVVGDTPPTAASYVDVFFNDPDAPSNAVLGYCTAKTNSLNCVPEVTVCGMPSLTKGLLFSVIAKRVRSQESGTFFWGAASTATPFRGGTLCVAQPLHRASIANSGGSSAPIDCTGYYTLRFPPQYLLANNLTPGTAVYTQCWSRDSGFNAPNNVGLTDAVVFIVLP